MRPALLALTLAVAASSAGVRDQWDFKLKDFVIGAWWGPDANDAELKLYRECGFNVVMTGRYMGLEGSKTAAPLKAQMDAAWRHGLYVLVDTYAKNNEPWGGNKWVTDFGHPTHHPASVEELKWLQEQIGSHPALAGYMIGDDQAHMTPRSIACTDYLHSLPKPHLMPWLCGWIAPDNLAEHNNPFEDPQIYPTLYSWGQSAEAHGQSYASTYWGMSRQCQAKGLYFWPMFNAAPPNATELVSDSLLRFPAYAAVAYGAEGIWYFCYNDRSLQKLGPHTTAEAAQAALMPNWPVARRVNQSIAGWGPKVLGRTSTGLFGSAFRSETDRWPFPEDAVRPNVGLADPAVGKLVTKLDDKLLVGILTKAGQKPLAMVVDCRLDKRSGAVAARRATLTFAPAVTSVAVLAGPRPVATRGNTVTVTLEGGEGVMLELTGRDLDALCTNEAIYAKPATAPAAPTRRTLTEADLAGIKAAKLRIDTFGSNPPPLDAKFVDLNGARLGKAPCPGGDSWSLGVLDLTAEQLRLVKLRNQITVKTEAEDAWKFRGVTLAVQLADGTWVKSTTDPTVWSVANWAYTEGKTWGKDGLAGPIGVQLG